MTNPLTEVLQQDEQYVSKSIQALRHYGLWELLESMPTLFGALQREVEHLWSSSPQDFLTSQEPNGDLRPSWNGILRLHMMLSAHQQFVFAASHLLRGHVTEVYGHVRRAIEGAGISYLSMTDTEAGKNLSRRRPSSIQKSYRDWQNSPKRQ
jgi:hypothetical protein